MPNKPRPSAEQTGGVSIGNIIGGIHNSIIAGRDVIINAFVGDTEELRANQNRQAMLELVENVWIKGMLNNSLHNQVLTELNMEVHPEAVERPWEIVLKTVGKTEYQLPSNAKILDIFDQMSGAMLILGEPGSGKTTTLLELARKTIARAKEDSSQPIPVVFNLSSWAEKKQPLEEWLVSELVQKYQIPSKIAQSWIENDKLLLLLDGLDEVSPLMRDSCVKVINDYRNTHLTCMAICSRLAEYNALTSRLRLQGAVLIKPLNPKQVDLYLKGAGGELAALGNILDADSALLKMAESPLMLNVMSLAYHGMSTETSELTGSPEASRRYIFDTYVQQMFKRRFTLQPYSPKHTTFYLSWLADKMTLHSQTVFLLEKLQPSWISSRGWRWLYLICTRLFLWLLLIPLFGPHAIPALLTAGLAVTIFDNFRFEHSQNNGLDKRISIGWQVIMMSLFIWLCVVLAQASFEVLTYEEGTDLLANFSLRGGHTFIPNWWERKALDAGLNWGQISGIQGSFTLGFIFGVFSGIFFIRRSVHRSWQSDIQTREALTWSWQNVRRGIKVWGFFGLFIGVIIGLALGLPISRDIYDFTRGGMNIEQAEAQARIIGLTLGVIVMIATFLLFLLLSILLGGMGSRSVKEIVFPNQGIILTLRNAFLMGMLTAITLMIIALVIENIPFSQEIDFRESIFIGILFGLLGFLWYGGLDILQHYLLRLIIWIKGYSPSNYSHFLDYTTERIFMRKVGGGYIFIHSMLMEHFAAMDKESIEALVEG